MTTPEGASRRRPIRSRLLLSTAALALLVVAAALLARRGRAKVQDASPRPAAVPVEVETLAEHPVEQSTEYVGTVKSRRSTTVQPQVEGFVTRVLVRSGTRVEPGTPLIQIEASAQRAAVANLESQRAAREAEAAQAGLQARRLKSLLDAGAVSRAEYDQAATALATADAQVKATDAQIREQRVTLGYYQVKAPTAGVVGDIPVRVGDSVGRETVLTTVVENAGLEVYVNVPVQDAARLKVGLPVHLVDDEGRSIASSTLSFVSSSVDPATQSVLAKAGIAEPGRFRTEQFVRVRIVWTEVPALTAPVTALNRINGQFFVYVAQEDNGAMVARQRAVEVGDIVGNDYVVRSGLDAGERLIVSGVQKLRDGAPVQMAAASSPQDAAGGSR